MSHHTPEAKAYNREVARLINEGMKCPTCDALPRSIESVEVEFGPMVTCRNGHSFLITTEEDDDIQP